MGFFKETFPTKIKNSYFLMQKPTSFTFPSGYAWTS